MNNSRTLLLTVLLAGLDSGLRADEPPPELHAGAYLHEIRTEVETPHVKWLKPSARPRRSFSWFRGCGGIPPPCAPATWWKSGSAWISISKPSFS